MATPLADFADVDALVDQLRAAGVSADVSASVVNVPGVWVQVRGVTQSRLSGPTYRLRLYLVAPDVDPRAAMDQLAELLAKVAPVVDDLGGPTGELEAVTVVMPDAAKLPALVIPCDLDTEPTPSP